MLLTNNLKELLRKVVLMTFPCLAVIIVATCIPYYEQRSLWPILVVYSLLSIVASFISIFSKNFVLTLTSAVNFSAILLYGQPVAIWSSLIEVILIAFLYSSKLATALNNAGQKFVFITIVAVVAAYLKTVPIRSEFSDLLLIGIYWISNITMCATVLSVIYNKSFKSIFVNMMKTGPMIYFLVLALGLISVRLYESLALYGLIPMLFVFALISRVFKQYHASLLKLEYKVEQEKQLNMSLITAMASVIDARDPYTSGHSWRVAYWGKRIATELKLTKMEIDNVYFGGILHDIGKIGIEDDILRKEGTLSAEEYEKIKLHPVIGYQILKDANIFSELLPAIRSHHERIDGNGYPDGLKENEIPLIAKILTITDAFDAMISDRPYRKGLSLEETLRRINEGAGSQFDTELTAVFIKLIEKTPWDEVVEQFKMNQAQLEAAVSAPIPENEN
ncbi:HD-GYP domain-containing protein [Paenibacillus sp. GP183]|uniref:HD-GYP domain-containing protein n=1 Tax=Paenibacillus sp. GP183 TaxID=1882751 RepID=UPI00089A0EA5|nr:HD-GYP domain-containing protein [Paenibacillus sp. GP183]SED13523.1 HD domain-containing protein [Paenibacillus sp. GP183]